MKGRTSWFFPDAELPPMGGDEQLFGHESLIVLNPNGQDARVEIALHWTDRPPTRLPPIVVGAGLVHCERATEGRGLLGHPTRVGVQYAISLSSDVPIVAQYGRLDLRLGNMAFYTTPGYCE